MPGASACPRPGSRSAAALVGVASAAIDVSDGLVADLGHLCTQSGVAARIAAESVPLSAAARRALAEPEVGFADLVSGGDDYELLFCAPPSARAALQALGRRLGLAVTRIGATGRGHGVVAVDAEGRPLPLARAGYRHF